MRRFALAGVGVAALVSTSCATTQESHNVSSVPEIPATPVKNPLLNPWSGPYGGVPPFDRIGVEHFEPALDASMEETLRAIGAIANAPAAPSFENTIVALERAMRPFKDLENIYGVWSSTLNGPDFQAVERKMAPRLAAFADDIVQNERLFARIDAVYHSPEKARLSPEQQRLTWLTYTQFVRSGARLDAAAKKRMAEINQRLATLYTAFSQNVLADEESDVLVLESEADLAGLPPSVLAGFKASAEARGMKGKWVVTNTRSAMEPFLTYSKRRDLREQVWRKYVDRGDHGDAHDNNAIVSEILRLRAERARLLGYATHAHWRVEDSMAKTPERAMALLEAVWPAAVGRVHQEVADMQAIADHEGDGGKIAPWDYRYYAEKVRRAKYDLDANQVKPYLQLEKLREAMFWVAGQLFDFSFTRVGDAPVYHPDVRVWEVTDKATGKHVGLWYFDPFARAGKRSGAWMDTYRRQERFEREITTIVSNNANFVEPNPGEPALISWEDAKTLFHEFGHALHGLSSSVAYPSLSGTAVPRDYVEFPSQLLEHWLSTPEVLNRFARHFQTGEPIPRELVAKIESASTFNQGFETVEYLASALVDLRLHLAGDRAIDPDAFERETLVQLGMPKEIVMRHRTPHFSHVFAGDAYSAGYYSYLWADVLTADAYEAFKEGKGPWDRVIAERLHRHVFSVGNSVDPSEGYRAFRGRDPAIDALMRKRGFPVPGGPARQERAK